MASKVVSVDGIKEIDIGSELDGKYLLPTLVDMGVRVYDDRLNRENLTILEEKAKRGGVGTILLHPHLEPKIDNEISLEYIRSQQSSIDIFPLVDAIKEEERLSEISILLKKGALSVFTLSDVNSYLLSRIFEYMKMHQKPLFIEATNRILRDVGVMNEGEAAFRLGLGGISKLEEISEVAKVIEFAEFYEVPVIFKNISTAKSLDLISQSPYCYAEVSVHHLMLDEMECEGYNTYAKLSPPLRDKEELERLREHLKNGNIDFLTSLHSPKSILQKDVSFDEAAFGIDAISYYLSLLYTKLDISLHEIVKLTSYNASKLLGIKPKGWVVFDPDATRVIDTPSPYQGQELQGVVEGMIEEPF